MDDSMTAARFQALTQRLARIEDQLVILSAKVGVPYEQPTDDEIPANVRTLLAAGKTTDAIIELRRLKNLSLVEAKSIIDQL